MNGAVFLFDLDDTLVATGYASWVACTDLLNDFLRSKGLDRTYTAEELGAQCAGVPLDCFVQSLAKIYEFPLSRDELARLNAAAEPIILEYFSKNLKPDDSVRTLLAGLRRSNHNIGIVSSSSNQWIETCLTAAELREFVNVRLVFSARSMNLLVKPDPSIYRLALSALPRGCRVIAVEDSPSGVKSAVAARVPVVLGCAPFVSPETQQFHLEKLQRMGATGIFDTWENFRFVLEQTRILQPTPAHTYGRQTSARAHLRRPVPSMHSTERHY
jgi:HAD superfamily hydrolase (TIGR01509 family)